MGWTGGTGSGDLLMGSGDTLVTGTVSAQIGEFGQITVNDANMVMEFTGQPREFNFRRLDAGAIIIANLDWQSLSNSGNERVMGRLRTAVSTDANGAERSNFQFWTQGGTTLVQRLVIKEGLFHPSATGGDQGNNSLNMGDVYDDSVLLTCYAIEAEVEGRIDVAELDRYVLDRRTEVSSEYPVAYRDDQVVYEVSTPRAIVETRVHTPARRFAERAAATLDPARFAEMWQNSGHLPGLPSREEWMARLRAGKKYGIGDMTQRLTEIVEVQAVHIDKLRRRLEAIEAAVGSGP